MLTKNIVRIMLFEYPCEKVYGLRNWHLIYFQGENIKIENSLSPFRDVLFGRIVIAPSAVSSWSRTG